MYKFGILNIKIRKTNIWVDQELKIIKTFYPEGNKIHFANKDNKHEMAYYKWEVRSLSKNKLFRLRQLFNFSLL